MIVSSTNHNRKPSEVARRIISQLRYILPEGQGSLPADIWKRRHLGIIVLLWLHVAGIICFALLSSQDLDHVMTEAALVACCALLAGRSRFGRRVRATIASLGLVTSSALLVHFSGGYIEFHFHFFVMVVVISLYQDWVPFILTIGYVLVHHGVVGVLDPKSVYNHPDAWANPWKWAAIHALFITGISIASIINWRMNEAARAHAELILGAAGEGIYGVDAHGNTVFVNQAGARLLGRKVEEMIGSPLHDILIGPTPNGAGCTEENCPIHSTLRNGTVHHVLDQEFTRKDGTTFPVEYITTPVLDHGKITGAVITFTDVTERKRADDLLRKSKEELEATVLERTHSVVERTLQLQSTNQELEREIAERERGQEALRESEQRYRTLFTAAQRQAQELMLLDQVRTALTREFDLPLIFRTVVEGMKKTFGYTQISLYFVEGDLLVLQHQVGYDNEVPSIPLSQGIIGRVVRTGQPILLEDVSADPTFIGAIEGVVSEVCVPLFDEGKVVGVLNVESTNGMQLTEADLHIMTALSEHIDIAIVRARLYSEQRENERKYRSVVDHVKEVIFQTDASGRWTFLNPAWTDITGFSIKESIGTSCLDYVHQEDQAIHVDEFLQLLNGKKELCKYEIRCRTKDGSFRWVEVQIQRIQGQGAVTGDQGPGTRDQGSEISGLLTDIADRKVFEQRLEYQARHDALTNLPNRAYFMERLRQALARSAQGSDSVAVLFVDLDNFKLINDSLGHRAGDHVLTVISQRLRECLPPGNTVARLGGDEFTILLESVAELQDAVKVAELIAEELLTPILLGGSGLLDTKSLDGQEVFVTASIGMALQSSPSDRPEDLLRRADVAMYDAKSKGKCRYTVFQPQMALQSKNQLQTEMELRKGIERKEFRIHYQPVLELETGRIVEVEALVRWQHPQRGLLLPGEFIPQAEETGLIVTIGQWVLEEACRQAREWQALRPTAPPLVMGVNLSARQLQHPTLVDDILYALEVSGLEPCYLKLEITEGIEVVAKKEVVEIFWRLKKLGIRLALDDFGTGYSALGYLKRLPVDTLKIDRTFVAGLGAEPEDTAIVHAVVAFAKTLNLSVTAEGIERPEQLAVLRSLKCDQGQGYFFSRPLPGEEIGELLEARKWEVELAQITN